MELRVSQAMKLLLRDKFKKNSGFTMIELLLSTLLISVIVSLVTLSYFNSVNASETTISIATSVKDARTAMYILTKEIRELSQIVEADADEIIFYSNVDSDDELEEIHYYLESSGGFYNLSRQVDGNNGEIVVTHLIKDQIFTYTTGYGQDSLTVPIESSELGNIRNISINLVIDQENTTEGNRTMNLETSITLRNRV